MSHAARSVLLFAGVTAALLAFRRIARSAFTTVEVAGASMLPALEHGDFLLVKRGRLPDDAAGLVALLRGPDARPMLKRVVGLPGESLRVGAHVEVNGRPLLERYIRGVAPPASYRGVQRLAAGEYFVLGDNRAASTDSRDFGAVRAEAIEGVALLRYWPPERLGWVRREARAYLDPELPAPGATEALA